MVVVGLVEDGVKVGKEDGFDVEYIVGTIDGIAVRMEVVGMADGVNMGDEVSKIDGIEVGLTVGVREAAVGVTEGAVLDGMKVGLQDGL